MRKVLLFSLLPALLLSACSLRSGKTEVLPDGPGEAPAEEEGLLPESPEELLAYAFAALPEDSALEGEESLALSGEIDGAPISYSQTEYFNSSALGTNDLTYYREVHYNADVDGESVSGSSTTNYENGALVSQPEGSSKSSQKVSADALSKNIRAALTAYTDAEAAAHYTVLDSEKDKEAITVRFAADPAFAAELIDRALTLMAYGYDIDLSGAVFGASRQSGDSPICEAILDPETGALLSLTLETLGQTFTLEEESSLTASAVYRLRILSRNDDVVPYIPGFSS